MITDAGLAFLRKRKISTVIEIFKSKRPIDRESSGLRRAMAVKSTCPESRASSGSSIFLMSL